MNELVTIQQQPDLLHVILGGFALATVLYLVIAQKLENDYLDEFDFREMPELLNRNIFFNTARCLFIESVDKDTEIFSQWFAENPLFYKFLLGNTTKYENDLQGLTDFLVGTYTEIIESKSVVSMTIRDYQDISRTIGYVDYTQVSPERPGEIIISVFLEPSQTDIGLGEEVIGGLCDHIFSNSEFKNIKKLILKVYPQNVGAIKCYLKCGFLPSEVWKVDPALNSWESQIGNYQKGQVPITMILSRNRYNQNNSKPIEEVKYQFELFMQAC